MVVSRRVLLALLLPLAGLAAAPAADSDWPPSAPAEQVRMVAAAGAYHITYPERVQYDGTHLTHDVHQTYDLSSDDSLAAAAADRRSGRGRGRRWRRGLRRRDRTAHYRLQLSEDEEVTLDVRPNHRLLAPGFVVERRTRVGRPGRLERPRRHCLMKGRLRGRPDSMVAISSCQGLSGYIHTDGQQYIVEPVKVADVPPGSPRPHLVYRRHAPGPGPRGTTHRDGPTCHTEGGPGRLAARSKWSTSERVWSRARRVEARSRRRHRSVSAERNVETLIVADQDVVEFYGEPNLEPYLLTIMNGVAQLYHDASIGNAINVILVRILTLPSSDEKTRDFDIGADADGALKSFCNWQSIMNFQEDHPTHHDVAVLLTRRNICSENQACNTLGLAEVSGMCQPSRSCNINQDTGLSVSYTIAHELGHNFGMNHDGPGNGCDQQNGFRKHVMSPNLVNDVTPVVWSKCSRREITNFLDRDWGHCLDDQPTDPEYRYPQEPPGMLYNADHQCRLLYGQTASHCQMGNVCETLWCSVQGRCVTKLEPAAEGTSCTNPDAPLGAVTRCSAGECVDERSRPRPVDGGWGGWGDWGACSRTCGTGVQSSPRHCDRPVPAHGGRYCVGERRRYRTCAKEACPEEGASFRAQQCSEYDGVPYQGRNYTWTPSYVQTVPCQLMCQPVGHHFTAVLSETVVDGTPCQMDSGICINGMCRTIGCDGVLDSGARADRCGVCHGNGSLCHTVRDTFTVEEPSDGYLVVAALPAGARSIRMEELEGTGRGSFLSVTAADIDTDTDTDTDNSTVNDIDTTGGLNANRFIQWSGERWVGGSAVYYFRDKHNESIVIPGPLKSPLVLKVLLQESVTRVRYEYTVPGHEGAEVAQVFSWRHQAWGACTQVCGGGEQTSSAACMEDEAGRVDDIYCTAEKPPDKTRPCNEDDCPSSWWEAPWSACSAECGRTGNRTRQVHCVRSRKGEWAALLDDECNRSERPADHEACRQLPAQCAVQWRTGAWEKCSDNQTCKRRRRVWCSVPGSCDADQRPPDTQLCHMARCRRRRHKRRRSHAAARDAPPLRLLERSASGGSSTTTTYRGRRARKMIARLRNIPTAAPAAVDHPANHTWRLGDWGECNSLCGGGRRIRRVQCIDLSRQASVELSRCPLPIPDMYEVCTQPCLEWQVDAWSPCSVPCGPGQVTRQVSCPAASRCDLSSRPVDSRPCWEGFCPNWQLD